MTQPGKETPAPQASQDVTPEAANPALQDTAAAPSVVDALIGSSLSDRYRIVRRIGEGGMGAVYMAEHTLMRKSLAVKVLHGELAQNAEILARFQREAQAASSIEHPNICSTTDFGRTPEGAFFMVMEFLDGRGLDAALRASGVLSWQRAAHIAQQICGVLDAAHELGIVHRDLKPENIMLIEYDGDPDYVKVMDFGVASMRPQDDESGAATARLTRAGVVYGTPAYMSPEQVMGQDVDARSDLYTLGVILYELLTGKLPFEGSITRMMSMHLTVPPPPLREAAPEVSVPPELEALVMQLLAKEPEQRPASASEARGHLLALLGAPLSQGRSTIRAQAAAMTAPLAQRLPGRDTVRARVSMMVKRWRKLPVARQLLLVVVPMGVAIILLLGVVTALVVSRDAPIVQVATAAEEAIVETQEVRRTLAEERDAFLAETGMRQALEQMARGEHASAIALLEPARATNAASAHLHYYLGAAYFQTKRYKDAMASYGETLKLDPRYARDPQLVADALDTLIGRDKEAAASAASLIKSQLGAQAATTLAEQAQSHRQKNTRKRAMELLQEMGEFEKLPPWQQLTIEMKNVSGCQANKDVIAKMVALGDPRVIPVLKEMQRLPRRSCGKFFNKFDCFKCFRGDVNDALKSLKVSAEEVAAGEVEDADASADVTEVVP